MQLSARDQRMASTICITCLCYFICNVTPVVGRTLGMDSGWLYNLLHSVYWMQYSMNVFVYATSNKQYREAYHLFLREVVFCKDRNAAVPNIAFVCRAQRKPDQEPEHVEIIELLQIP
jgi:hypothetical protein